MTDHKEVNMSRAEQERQEVGLSPEEVRELNTPKPKKDMTRRDLVKKAANVLAASITAAAGTGLAATAQEALNSAPAPIIQEQKPDTKRDNPPAGVVFRNVPQVPQVSRADAPVPAPQPDAPVVEAPPPDAPVEGPKNVVATVFMPAAWQGTSRPETREPETPLYLREFGAPERGVIMRNKVEQGGGNPAWVEMGDPELFENMMYLRERWGRPDLKAEVTFYQSSDLLIRTPGRPDYNPADWTTFGLVPWESYGGNNGTFKQYGLVLFRYREADKTIERHIALPEVLPGKTPTQIELYSIHSRFIPGLQSMIGWTNEDRSTTVPLIRPGDPVSIDLRNHPLIVFENGELKKSFVWIRMDTVPTTGGK